MRKTETEQNKTQEKIFCFILWSIFIVLSLDVDGILPQETIGNVLGPCIAVKD